VVITITIGKITFYGSQLYHLRSESFITFTADVITFTIEIC